MPVPSAAGACAGSARTVRHEPATGPRAVPNEELEYVPGRFIVNRIVRPRLTCYCCERFV
ncbi:IS66 family transposase zinc-finger binding domain-containing protein [Paracoccus sp. MKU1]|uniref:IS66 family transposase zinc-finger binding domain-containing protein n=1 Tax=Paracoccus sp. MKU1 TaxID=1745182 RepID=UPI00350ED3A2